jgi:hypothetical protein
MGYLPCGAFACSLGGDVTERADAPGHIVFRYFYE